VTKKRKSGEGVIFRGIMSGLVAFLMVGNLSAREPALAVIAEDLSGEVGKWARVGLKWWNPSLRPA